LEGCELRLVWWGFFPTKVDVSCRKFLLSMQERNLAYISDLSRHHKD
jgi:hypothetical protein